MKGPAVVDTNVPIVASGSSGVSAECVNATVQAIRTLIQGGLLILDDGRRILREYERHLSLGGQPRPGTVFLKWVYTNYANPSRCCLVHIRARPGDREDYEEFPDDEALASFDPSDRKFVAVARAHPAGPPIKVATDRGWWIHRHALAKAGVTVDFLCRTEIEKVRHRP